MKKIVVLLFSLMFFISNAFAAIENFAAQKKIEEQILGVWEMKGKDNDIQFFFRKDKVLQGVFISNDTGGSKMIEFYYIIKDRLLLTIFASTVERWKVFYIKKIKSEGMILIDLTPFAKSGDVTFLLDMIKKGKMMIGKEWNFKRK